jgi:hypothetical protein
VLTIASCQCSHSLRTAASRVVRRHEKMIGKLKILLLILTVGYAIYKVAREIFWVIRDQQTIDENLSVKLAFDEEFSVVLSPDIFVRKRIKVRNRKTNAKLSLNFESAEWNLYFIVEESPNGEVLRIIDQFLGQNTYKYSTLKLLEGEKDCFKIDDNCGGYNDIGLDDLGEFTLIYNYEGFLE